MRLSSLQKYIIQQCFESGNSAVSKGDIEKYYRGKKVKPRSVRSDITRSIERLIRRDILIGFGKKTSKKWYLHKVKLTPLGRRIGREISQKQQKLPLSLLR